jgi:hypothetical protein
MSRTVVTLSLSVAAVSLIALAVFLALPSAPAVGQDSARPDFDRVFSGISSATAFTDADREALRRWGLKRLNAARLNP